MQLVAYGAQDIYLTGNPMITYFKVVYRRHTNFAMESIQQTFNGNVAFGSRVSALISRNGDLVSGMTLEADLPALAATTRWTDDVGHHLINQVEVEIGGQLIDRHYADWLEIWAQLTVPAAKMAGYRELVGQSPKDHLSRPNGLQAIGAGVPPTRLYIPLQFWFCRNVGLALPLIALQYHEVKVNIQFRNVADLIINAANAAGTAPADELNAALWVDYIYLDTDERRRFAQVSHEYLIEQLQLNNTSFDSTSVNVDLNFNHPVKELVWAARYTDVETARQWSNFSDTPAVTAANVDITTAAVLAEQQVALTNSTGPAPGNGFTLGISADIRTDNGDGGFATTGVSALTGTANLAVALNAGDVVLIGGARYIVSVGANADASVTGVRVLTFPGFAGTVGGPTALLATAARKINDVITQNQLRAIQPSANTMQDFKRPALATSSLTALYASNPVSDAILKLNGHDRFASRKGSYFNRVQPLAHHTNVPASPGVNVYSFALKPEEHQPSGTCNFSRIDNAKLNLTLVPGFTADGAARGAAAVTGSVKVFATNYNVLRVMSGMGGLAYSN